MLAYLQIRGSGLVLALSLLAGFVGTQSCAAADPAGDARCTLWGDVTDPAGRPIENARIFLIRDSTHTKVQTWTDQEGSFVFSRLSPDNYTIQAIQTGFAPVQIPSIVLGARENRSIDIRFQIPRREETTTIHAGEFEEASVISTRISPEFAEVLPLNGHTLQPLLLLIPGVVMTANNKFSFNGQSTNRNYFTVDGASVNLGVRNGNAGTDLGQDAAYSALGTTANLISLDSLDELVVRSSTISPMIGRQSGGHVQLTSLSGGDAYHGEAFELFRNSALNAQDWFTTTDTAVNTNLRLNDFGGVFSGPVPRRIRWIGRTTLFLSEESLRLVQPTTLATYVPSDSLRSRAAPRLLPFLDVFPTSDRPDPGIGTSRYRLGISNPSIEDNFAARFDTRRNKPVMAFVRYNHSGSSRTSTDTGWALSSAERHSQSLTVGAVWNPRANILNDMRVNFGGNTGIITNSLHKLSGAVIPAEKVFRQGIGAKFRSPSLNYNFLGATYASGSTGYQPIRQINVTNSLLVQHGAHTLGFGFDYLRLSGGMVPSDFNLSVNFLSQRSILTGIADSLVIQSQDAVTVEHDIFSLYAQDSWKVRRRFALDYGVRWDVSPAPNAKNGEALYTVTSSKDIQSMRLAPAGTELYPTVHTNFGPRAGFSWQFSDRPEKETILHGGLGGFYSLGNTYSMAPASNFPHLRQATLFYRPYPPGNTLPAPSSNSLLPPYSGQTFFAYADGYATPAVYQFSAGVEQHLGMDRKMAVAYIGSESRHLPIVQNLTDPNPNFIRGSSISEVRNIGTAFYSSLQAQYRQKITSSTNMLASYTWAHCIDDVSGDINGVPRKALAPVTGEYSNSDFDLRQSFAMGFTYKVQDMHSRSLIRETVRSWSFGSLVIARGGMPIDITFTRPIASGLQPTRPNLAKNVRLFVPNRHQPFGSMLNYQAFQIPAGYRQGDLPRNSLRAHSAWQCDLSMQRDFHLAERLTLRVRSEFFNAFNHPNFGAPDTDLGTYADGALARNPNFGHITRMLNTQLGGLQQTFQVGGPRSIQASLKLRF